MWYIIASIIIFVALFAAVLIQKHQIDQLTKINHQYHNIGKDIITAATKTNNDCLTLINRLKTKIVTCENCIYYIKDEDSTKGHCIRFSDDPVRKDEFCSRAIKRGNKNHNSDSHENK